MPAGEAAARAADDDVIAVGRVGPARGVRGETFVEPWTDAPHERFAPGNRLRTEPASAGPLEVDASSTAGGKLVVHFAGVVDRAGAEALRGVTLFVRAADRPPLADAEEFYDTDLVGLAAVGVDGAPIGPVRDVLHAAGASYLVLDVAGHERLVPFVAAIVPSVDVAAGTVTVDPPPGLFDL
ncbi:ribosome maturation factor RimM [uncultured Jatrophihabitans sp.]|uniref:ribosome maturation factor RimM n=1 Tax=uncultured Jatrophihabitans sp. TaxID=1610747 RepID=UPI0035CAD91F